MRKINVPVRLFGVPVPRVGSIESHSGYGSAPMDGQEVHLLFQKERKKEDPTYQPEKWVSFTFTRKPYQFVVSGRMDGYLHGEPSLIEEVKSSFEIEGLSERLAEQPDHPYFWQLRTYGYIQYKLTGEIPLLKLIMISTRNLNRAELEVEMDIHEYEIWLEARLGELVQETQRAEKVHAKRVAMAESLKFPFESPRKMQIDLIETIEKEIKNHKHLLIQAPTGLGKTIGVLYPMVKESFARGQKVIYLTPKNSQHQVAEEAIDRLNQAGSKIRSLTISAKSKVCLKPEPLCRPDYCEYARDFYKKVEEQKLVERMSKIKNLSTKRLMSLGEETQCCPFELGVEAVKRADVIIGDYNYVFSPRGLRGRLTESLLDDEKPNVVVDEAHNIPQRVQDLYSPALSTWLIKRWRENASQVVVGFKEDFEFLLKEAERIIRELAAKGIPRVIDESLNEFYNLETELRKLVASYLESSADILPQDPLLQFSSTWGDFLEALELKGDQYVRILQRVGEDVQIKVVCRDASAFVAEALGEFNKSVSFSATLKPFDYFSDMMGLKGTPHESFEFLSPFQRTHRKLMVIPQISTKLKDRSSGLSKLREVVRRVVELKSGNYIVLFPSFEYLFSFVKDFKIENFSWIVQSRESKPADVQRTLDKLDEPNGNYILLAVQGGVYSEGVDYVGSRLIGAFVVGPALPTFDFERDKVREYFEKTRDKSTAFKYTYVYPAMSKAIQSAGRVIRGEEEKGIIVLIDSRFLEKDYSESMPSDWFEESPRELVSQAILKDITEFWKSHDQ